jgi:hypothetical protein
MRTGLKIRLSTGLGLAALLAIGGPVAAQEQKQQHHEPPLYMRELNSFEGKTLEQKVQELTDREEIRSMIATYAHRVAHGVPHYELFTDDGAFSVRRLPSGETEFHSGLNEIANTRSRTVERFGDSLSAQKPLPMIHNFLIALDGDEGLGMNSNELRIPERGKSIIASGYYEDRYRRVNGKWRFVRRDTTFIHWVPIQQGWARPVDAGPTGETRSSPPAK